MKIAAVVDIITDKRVFIDEGNTQRVLRPQTHQQSEQSHATGSA